MLCRDRCGYCTFAKPPARLDVAVPHARRGAAPSPGRAPRPAATRRCSPSARRPRSATRSPPSGSPSTATPRPSTTSSPCAALVLDETGLLPHANAGALVRRRARPRCAPVARRQGMMIETLRRRPRPPTAARPTRRPSAGWPPSRPPASWRIPFTTGILVGIGEDRADRLDALEAIADSAPPPRPRAGGDRPELPAQAGHRDAPRAAVPARRASSWPIAVGPPDPARPTCTCRRRRTSATTSASLLDAGIDDWGGVSPVTADHVNPERPVARARPAARRPPRPRGTTLAPRLTIYPEFVARPRALARRRRALRGARPRPTPRASAATTRRRAPERSASRRRRHRRRGRAVGRRSTAWYSAPTSSRRCSCPAAPRPRRGRRGARRRARPARRSAIDEIVTLFSAPRARGRARSPRWPTSCAARSSATTVTFVRNRNINYTNVCTFKCRFCGFSKGPLSLNLRGTPVPARRSTRSQRRVRRGRATCGATEVCLQGGIHPDFDGDYYIDVARAVKEAAPDIHVHGFTALEVTEGATPARRAARRLPRAG